MSLVDLLRGVRQTFVANRVRALLTLLGVMIGSGSIVMLAGLLKGAERALTTLNQGVNESDTLRISQSDVPLAMRDRTTRPLSFDDGRALDDARSLTDVDVVVEARRESLAYHAGREKRVRIMGVVPDAREMYRLHVARGRFIDEEDLARGRRVAVIGAEIHAQLLDGDADVLGRQLKVDDQTFTIVGILEHKPVSGSGTGTWMWDRRLVVPRSAFDAAFSPEHDVHSIFLRVRGREVTTDWMSAVAQISESILLRRHLGVKNFEVADRTGQGEEEIILLVIQILLLGTGLLAMFVGGINIMNIMLVTVTERTAEIGLRRAVGATPRSILGQFLVESAALSFVGGAAGAVSGIVLTWLIVLGLRSAFGSWTFYVVPWAIALGLALAVLTGVVFGLLPAWRAARLSPVEALRSTA